MTDPTPTSILLVDDERSLREPLAEYLVRQGFAVREAESAAQARTLLAQESPDLALLDIMMPGEDGLSLCRHLVESRGLPTILLTAKGEAMDRIIGLEIVGVRPKPEGLSGNLRQAFEERTITNADLQTMQSRGFYPTQSGEMLSNEGELLVRTEEAVLYTLRFGEILYGSGNAVAIGDETSDDQDAGVGENRYVLITAEFDPSGLPEPSRPSNRDFENKAEGQWTDADRENKERADLYAQWERHTETGQRRADELSTRFAKWYYVISAGSYNRVHKTRDDFLKEIEEEDEEPVEPPA